jgi:hypothetical protein
MNDTQTFLSVVLVPAISALFVYLYKSKCQNVNLCWGCINVARDVRGEEATDQLQTNNTSNNLEISASV